MKLRPTRFEVRGGFNQPLMPGVGFNQLTKALASGVTPPWLGYVAGCGGIAVASGLTLALERWTNEPVAPFAWFAVSAIIAAWLGGIVPGITTAVAGFLIGDWFFVPPAGTFFSYKSIDVVRLGNYALTTGIPLAIVEALHRVRRRFQAEFTAHEQSKTTANQRAQGLLAGHSEERQRLAQQLLKIQEAERRKLARDLHDQVGQSLSLVQLHLQSLQMQQAHGPANNRLQECCQILDKTIDQVQSLSLDLRPAMLDDLGLVHALRWYTNQARSIGLNAVFTSQPPEMRLDPALETTCYRIVQEALTNVIRHARARWVAVDLQKQVDCLHVLVCDNGTGFNVEGTRQNGRQTSLGLLGMEERAALAGGKLEIKSTPNHGTEVRAIFPLGTFSDS